MSERFAWSPESLFRRKWTELSDVGKCDDIDGAEFRRVFSEWQAAGCLVGGLESFIVARANIAHDGHGPSDNN